MKNILTLLAIFLALDSQTIIHAHGHAHAGAVDSNLSGGINLGDQLKMYFEPGTTNTNLAANNGANTYGLDGFGYDAFTTLTSLHQSSDVSLAPNYNLLGALSGSYVVAQLQSIIGPTGARVAFYEAGGTDPTWIFTIGTGFTFGNGEIALTELSWFSPVPAGSFPSSPFGHLHGRRYAVDQVGNYTGTWILTDTEGLLADSANFTMTLSAIPEPAGFTLWGIGALVVLCSRFNLRVAYQKI